MKKIFPVSEKVPRIIYYVLLSLAGALIVLFITGTIIGLVRSRDSEPLLTFGNTVQVEQVFYLDDDIRVYPGLGRLRIQLADSSILILSIAFPYSASDIAFSEELAAKIDDLRTLAIDYFSSLPMENFIQLDDNTAKQELLRRFNSILRLGRIEVLYFTDMMVLN